MLKPNDKDKIPFKLENPIHYKIGDDFNPYYECNTGWEKVIGNYPRGKTKSYTPVMQWFGQNLVPFYKELGWKGHNGIDLKAMMRTRVYSMCDGIVDDISNSWGAIWIVTDTYTIDGSKCRFKVAYGHLSDIDVEIGQVIKTGDFIGLSGNCFDKETEVLTSDGWKYFKDLNGTEKVATLNIEKDELEFQKPLDYTKKFEKYMYLNETGKSNFCVSCDHNMLVYKGRKEDKLKLIEFNKLPYKRRSKFKHKTNWVGKEREYITIPSIIQKGGFLPDKILPEIKVKMDDWLYFLGIVIADGNVDIKRNRVCLSQSFSYKENIKIIDKLYNKLPFRYNSNIRKRWRKHNSIKEWNISGRQLSGFLKDVGTGKDKKAPDYIKDLSSRQIKIFLNGFFMGDGYERRNKERYYYPGIAKKLADQIQEYILKTGGTASIHTSAPHGVINYTVTDHNSENSWVKRCDVKRIEYNDYSYCVTVPNKTLYVRRKGSPIFLGNTGKYTTGPHLHVQVNPMYLNSRDRWYEDSGNGYAGSIDFNLEGRNITYKQSMKHLRTHKEIVDTALKGKVALGLSEANFLKVQKGDAKLIKRIQDDHFGLFWRPEAHGEFYSLT